MIRAVLERFAGMRRTHLVWFALVFSTYPIFLVLSPPLQLPDHPSNWSRTWSVASGDLLCRRIPKVAEKFVITQDYRAIRNHEHAYFFSSLDQARAVHGSGGNLTASGGACVAPPLGYLLGGFALATLTSPYDPRVSAGLVSGYYGVRVANWLLLSAAVALGLAFLPRFRTTLLAFYMLPFTVEGVVALSSFPTAAALVIVLLVLAETPERTAWAAMAVTSALVATELACVGLVPVVLAHWGAKSTRVRWWLVSVVCLAAGWVVSILVVNDPEWYSASSRVHPREQIWQLMITPYAWWAVWFRGWAELFGGVHQLQYWGGLALDARGVRSALVWAPLSLLCACAADLVERTPGDTPVRHRSVWIVAAAIVLLGTAAERYVFNSPVGFRTVLGLRVHHLLIPVLLALFSLHRAKHFAGPRFDRLQPWAGHLARFASFVFGSIALRNLLRLTLGRLAA